jgi:hypothetical protein
MQCWKAGQLTWLCLIGVATWPTPAAAVGSTDRCPDRAAQRQVYFGDLHIHTGLSADAMLFGTTNRPDDAYRFARGETIAIRSNHGRGPEKPATIARPLDFAAVTDHAENIGAISLCTTPGSPAYQTDACKFVRAPLPMDDMAVFATQLSKVFETMYSDESICGPGRERCRAAASTPWAEIQAAANQANDACAFTAFIGYEYSPTPRGSKLHHNVVFRGSQVMAAPISSNETPSMIDFWRRLKQECKDTNSGCDVIAIPHNPNLGNGRMFALTYGGETDPARQREIALLRSEIEPVVEMFQEKGDSECRNGMWNVLGATDELCNFEKYRDWQGAHYEDCQDGQGWGALRSQGCVSRLDYTRYALAAGLAEERRIGANPHKFGVIGSTDNHEGTAADVDERLHDGSQRPPAVLEPGRMSTGGLAAVWAEENTREAIFDAMRRREIFATSGTRLQVRFFGGWSFDDDLCNQADLVARGYAEGVPMGGDLAARAGDTPPTFVVSALADPGTPTHPGTPLERIQIVKVWAGEGSALHQAVFDLAGGDNDASVDPQTCELQGRSSGAMSLCGVWRDPAYDPSIAAAYYARVIENPSCRYTGFHCARAAAKDRPGYCDDPSVAKQSRERAWSSPIWLAPADRVAPAD